MLNSLDDLFKNKLNTLDDIDSLTNESLESTEKIFDIYLKTQAKPIVSDVKCPDIQSENSSDGGRSIYKPVDYKSTVLTTVDIKVTKMDAKINNLDTKKPITNLGKPKSISNDICAKKICMMENVIHILGGCGDYNYDLYEHKILKGMIVSYILM